MGRRNRRSVLYDGCFAHVFSRSNEKRYIFQAEEDFKEFKSLLLQSKLKYSFRIHHYCLMHTHFHLLVALDSVREFSEGLKWVKWHYAKYFNFRQQRFGPLWRDRFKSLVVENEAYLHACGKYIERNPVEAGMVNKSEDWMFSSSAYYLEGKNDVLVDGYAFDGTSVEIPDDPGSFFTTGSIIGSELFKIHHEEGLINGMPVPS